jgi:alpha-beta hydrolase superfamily lysophospholipase
MQINKKNSWLENQRASSANRRLRSVAGALGIFASTILFLQACGGQPLEPWHTVVLTEEFRAGKADEVRTFEDYLQLEDRLFAQLESKVYRRTEPGPGNALMRYSKGSASDPQGREPNWNRSFELPAAAPVGGVLLLHGMSDSPYSLRALGEELNRRNYWVVGLRLPGHGTAPSGLLNVRWEDMAAAVQLAAEHLAQKAGKQPIHMIGYSTGAPLALDFTLNALDGKTGPVPSSLVLISPAIGISAAAAAASWKRRLAMLPGLGNLAWLTIEPEFDPFKYNSFATNAGDQVHRLTHSVSSRIASRARSQQATALPPMLVFKSNADSTVSTEAVVTRLLGRLDPNRHELVLFDVNRYAAKSMLLVSDPRALTERVMGDNRLPFAVTLVANDDEESAAVVARHQAPFSADVSQTEQLDMAWPGGVISLSHVALPIPPDDPLYGQRPPGNQQVLFLGQMAIQGERGMLALPAEWLLRLRNNPFYPYLETRALDWIGDANGNTANVDAANVDTANVDTANADAAKGDAANGNAMSQLSASR